MVTDIKKILADGILCIGDPHQSSRAPGRRLDKLFYVTVALKIEQAMKIAQEKNLIPLFLGDFFDREDDTDGAMLVRTIQALKTDGHKPWTLVGNHDKRRTVLTNDTALSILIESGMILRMPDNGPGFVLESVGFEGKPWCVGVGSTGYDNEVPKDVTNIFDGVDDVIWATHHDWMFENGYPNAMQPYEINGCSMVINGHNHVTKPQIKRGQTTYANPGNITRMSIDTNKHVPRVWVYKPGSPRLMPIALSFEKEVFDWTGRIAHAVQEDASESVEKSEFVTMLTQEIESEKEGGNDFQSRLNKYFEKNRTSDRVKSRLNDLFEKVSDEAK